MKVNVQSQTFVLYDEGKSDINETRDIPSGHKIVGIYGSGQQKNHVSHIGFFTIEKPSD